MVTCYDMKLRSGVMTCHRLATLVSDTVSNRSGDLRDTISDFENCNKDVRAQLTLLVRRMANRSPVPPALGATGKD